MRPCIYHIGNNALHLDPSRKGASPLKARIAQAPTLSLCPPMVLWLELFDDLITEHDLSVLQADITGGTEVSTPSTSNAKGGRFFGLGSHDLSLIPFAHEDQNTGLGYFLTTPYTKATKHTPIEP